MSLFDDDDNDNELSKLEKDNLASVEKLLNSQHEYEEEIKKLFKEYSEFLLKNPEYIHCASSLNVLIGREDLSPRITMRKMGWASSEGCSWDEDEMEYKIGWKSSSEDC